MADEDPFEDIAAIAREMKAIGDLGCLGCSLPRATGVVTAPIATDQLRLTMRAEPGGKRIGRPLGQQIDHAMSFEVGEDRAVMVTAPQREIIHAEHGRRADRWLGQGAHEAEQRHAAGRADASCGEAHAGASTDGQAEVREEGLQRHTAPRVAGDELRHLLGEGAARAGGGAAAETADMEMEEDTPTADGLVGDVTDVV